MPAGERLHGGQRGFTFVLVLLALAMSSIGLAVVGPTWSERLRREREQDLLHIGRLYAEALVSYRDASPGSLKQYPLRLEHLLEDPRFVGTRRHLRRLYPDPLGGGRPWGLVHDAQGRVIGVFSQSEDEPLMRRSLDLGTVQLPPARHYADWKFIPKATP